MTETVHTEKVVVRAETAAAASEIRKSTTDMANAGRQALRALGGAQRQLGIDAATTRTKIAELNKELTDLRGERKSYTRKQNQFTEITGDIREATKALDSFKSKLAGIQVTQARNRQRGLGISDAIDDLSGVVSHERLLGRFMSSRVQARAATSRRRAGLAQGDLLANDRLAVRLSASDRRRAAAQEAAGERASERTLARESAAANRQDAAESRRRRASDQRMALQVRRADEQRETRERARQRTGAREWLDRVPLGAPRTVESVQRAQWEYALDRLASSPADSAPNDLAAMERERAARAAEAQQITTLSDRRAAAEAAAVERARIRAAVAPWRRAGLMAGGAIGYGLHGVATGADSPLGSLAGPAGAITGLAAQAGGNLLSTIGGALVDLLPGEHPGLSTAVRGVLGGLGSALGPIAGSLVGSSMQNAQRVYDAFATFEHARMLAAPNVAYLRQSQFNPAMGGVIRHWAELGFDPSDAAGLLGQMGVTAGYDIGAGGPEVLTAILAGARSGITPDSQAQLLRAFRLGGGARAQDLGASSARLAAFAHSRGMAPSQASELIGGFGGFLQGFGDQGIDVDASGQANMLTGLSALRGLEGTRGLDFMERTRASGMEVAQGGGNPLAQIMWLRAASRAGFRDYQSQLMAIERQDPAVVREMLGGLQGMGPRAPLVMQRLGIAASVTQATNMLSGQEGLLGPGAGLGPYAQMVPGAAATAAGLTAGRIETGAPLAPAMATLVDTMFHAERNTAALGAAFGVLTSDVLPTFVSAIKTAAEAGGSLIGIFSDEALARFRSIIGLEVAD